MLVDVICIYGPTASGKSDLAIELALAYAKSSHKLEKYQRMEIINCDAMQCYQGLPICTNKPSTNDLELVPHHLFGFLDPIKDIRFHVHDFRTKTRQLIQQLHEQHILPILCGGTSYYMQSVLEEQFLAEEVTEHSFEKEDVEFTPKEVEEMYQQLKEVNPSVANKLHPNNVRKIRNALANASKQSLQQEEQTKPTLYYKNCIFIYLDVKEANKEILKERINKRCLDMVQKGLVQELQDFYHQYKDYWNCNHGVFQSIGIKQFDFLITKREDNVEPCVEAFQGATRKYARKQRMWFTNYWSTNKSCIVANHAPCLFFEVVQPSQISKTIVPSILDILFDSDNANELVQQCQVSSSTKDDDETEWKKHVCQICNKECNGSKEWTEHVKSKRHKSNKKKTKSITV